MIPIFFVFALMVCVVIAGVLSKTEVLSQEFDTFEMQPVWKAPATAIFVVVVLITWSTILERKVPKLLMPDGKWVNISGIEHEGQCDRVRISDMNWFFVPTGTVVQTEHNQYKLNLSPGQNVWR